MSVSIPTITRLFNVKLDGAITAGPNAAFIGTFDASQATFAGLSFSGISLDNITLNNPNIVGGTMSNTALSNVTIANSSISSTNITGGTTTGQTINNANITNATITGGTLVSFTLTNPIITGGTITGSAITNATLSGGTSTNLALTTPAITGGTSTNQTLTTPAITGGTATNVAITGGTMTGVTSTNQIINTPTITGGTATNVAISGGTITGVTSTNQIINNPTITGGTSSGMTLTTATITSPAVTLGTFQSPTLTGVTTLTGSIQANPATVDSASMLRTAIGMSFIGKFDAQLARFTFDPTNLYGMVRNLDNVVATSTSNPLSAGQQLIQLQFLAIGMGSYTMNIMRMVNATNLAGTVINSNIFDFPDGTIPTNFAPLPFGVTPNILPWMSGVVPCEWTQGGNPAGERVYGAKLIMRMAGGFSITGGWATGASLVLTTGWTYSYPGNTP